MKFANIIYTKRNDRLTIGDDMQLLAIENLYKYMGINYDEVVRIPYNELSTYNGEYVILPISFPLTAYSHNDLITCFSDRIIPVFLGLCVLQDTFTQKDIEYFKKYEPIGCRDEYTLKNMRKNGIKAYLNTCMSVGFPKRIDEKDLIGRKKVICVDVNGKLKEKIPQELLPDCEFLSHTFYKNEFDGTPEELCKKMYEKYIAEARLIITDRIHAALPCAAAGLPVVFAKDRYSYRFSGIDKIMKIYTEKEFDQINWNPKPYEFENLKKQLLENAKSRILKTYEENRYMYDLSYYFENYSRPKYNIEFLNDTYNYIDSLANKEIKYILWGVTQTATLIKSYFDRNYPNARLVGIVDRDKRFEFCGCNTTSKDIILENKNAVVFVTTGAAIRESNLFFKENNIKNYFQCCVDNISNKNDGMNGDKNG